MLIKQVYKLDGTNKADLEGNLLARLLNSSEIRFFPNTMARIGAGVEWEYKDFGNLDKMSLDDTIQISCSCK